MYNSLRSIVLKRSVERAHIANITSKKGAPFDLIRVTTRKVIEGNAYLVVGRQRFASMTSYVSSATCYEYCRHGRFVPRLSVNLRIAWQRIYDLMKKISVLSGDALP
ncbi:hypothetical protein GALL_533080 [mine drainage metagenome]|uniref:Uncharacterized protein n=1 Tax=mine drainage metagenome TaxID=410659 RepID=A0A1J5P395_9ZZZZ